MGCVCALKGHLWGSGLSRALPVPHCWVFVRPCGWGTWLVAMAVPCAPECSRGVGREEADIRNFSPTLGLLGHVRLSVRPEAGSYSPRWWGPGAWTSGGNTQHPAKPGVPLGQGDPDSKQPRPAPVCPFVSLLWPAPPPGGPSHMALACRPELPDETSQDHARSARGGRNDTVTNVYKSPQTPPVYKCNLCKRLHFLL